MTSATHDPDRSAEKKLYDDSYRVFFDAAPNPMFIHEVSSPFIDANKSAIDIFGYTKDELLSIGLQDIAADDAVKNIAGQLDVLTREGALIFFTVLKAKSGERIPVEISAKIIETGKLEAVFSVVRVLSDRLTAEEKLRDSEHLLGEAQRIAHLGDWIWDLSTGKLDGSDEAFRIFGFEPNEIEPTFEEFMKHVHPDDRENVSAKIASTLNSGAPYDIVYRIIRKDGVVVVAHVLAEVIRNSGGEATHMMGTFQDITLHSTLEDEILAGRNRYKNLVENLGPRFVLFQEAINGTILYVSPGAKTVFGMEPAALLNKNIAQEIEWVETSRTDFEWYKDRILTEGHIESLEEQFVHPDGGIRTLNTNAHLVRDQSGNPIRIDSIVEDITIRKQAESYIALNEARLTEAQKIASLGTWEWDLINNSVYWSPIIYALLGISPAKRSSYEFYASLVHPDDRRRFGEELQTAIDTHTAYESVHRLLVPDGRDLVVSLKGEVALNSEGVPRRMVGTLMDITERAAMEREIRESRDRYKNLVEDLGDAFTAFRYDLEGRLMYVSPSVERLFGRPAGELIGKQIHELANWTPETLQFMAHKIPALLQIERVNGFEDSFYAPDGTTKTISVNAHIVKNESGRPQCIEGIFEDVTERKKAEKSLQQSERQLREAQRIARVGNWTFNVSEETLEINEGIARICGLDPALCEIPFEQFVAHITENDRRTFMNQMADAMLDREEKSIILRFHRPDGAERYIQTIAVPLSNDNKQVVEFFGTMLDITDHYLLERELEKSGYRYRRLIEDLGEKHVVYQHKIDGTLTYVSPSIEPMFGVTQDEAIGTSFIEAIDWNVGDLKHHLVAMERLIDGAPPEQTEIRYRHRDGSLRVLSLYAHITTNEQGESYIEGIGEDTTERKRTEEALRESRERFDLAVTATNEGLWDSDVVAGRVYYSPRLAGMLGYQANEVPPTTDFWRSLLHPEDKDNINRQMIAISESDANRFSMEFRLQHKEGHYIHILSRGLITRNEAGAPLRWIGTYQDITDQKHLEHKLIETSDRYKNLVEDMGETFAVYRHTNDGKFLYVSPGAKTVFGIPAEECLGKNLTEIIDWTSETRRTMLRSTRKYLRGERIYSVEGQYFAHDGTLRTVLNTAHPVFDADGNVMYIDGICEDVTSRKQSEIALLEREAQLRHAQQMAHIGNWIFDIATEALAFSDEMYYIYGVDPATDLSSLDKCIQFIHSEDVPRLYAAIEDAVVNLNPYHLDHRIVRPDGEIRYVSVHGEVRLGGDGAAACIVGTMQDVTGQHLLQQELQESRERYRSMVEDLGDKFVVYRHDVHGIIQYTSPGTIPLFGIDPKEAIGKSILEIITWTPRTLENFDMNLAYVLEHGRIENSEDQFINPAGEIRTLSINAHVVYNENREPLYIEGICEDITNRKQIEEALRMSEERFNLAVRATNDGIFDVDLLTGEVYFSDRWKEMLGYQPAEIENSLSMWEQLIHPEDAPRVAKIIEEVHASDVERYEMEFRLRHKNGSWVLILGRGIVIRDENGKPIRRLGTAENITEKRRLEETLKVYKQFADSSSQAFGMASPGTIVTYANKSLVHLLGAISPDEIAGKSFIEFYPPELQDFIKNEVIKTLIQEGTWTGELRLRAIDGTEIPTIESFFLIRDDKGEPLYISDVMTPIAELKEKEEALERARAAAELANKTKSEFLANISHEIRTPMNAIIGMNHLALNTAMTPKQRDYLLKIDNAAKMLLGIINDVLDFSKIEAGKLELEHEAFDLEHTVVQCLDLAVTGAHRKNLELIADFEPTLPKRIMGDSFRLGQVLNNLLQNAVKFTTQGEVILAVREMDRTGDRIVLEFSIADTGIGIPNDQKEKLFNVFTQADGSITRKYGGTGLGLSICRQLVELMDGTIGVVSDMGKGSTFSFIIPVAIAPDNKNQTILPATDPELAGKSVLIVDDNPRVIEAYTRTFRHLGLEVRNAMTVDEALKLFATSNPADLCDLLILDSEVDQIPGMQLMRDIAASINRHLPALLSVASPLRNRIISDVQEAGFRGILEKPVHPNNFMQAIRQALLPAGTEATAMAGKQKAKSGGRQDSARVLIVEDNDVNQEVAIELLKQAGLTVSAAWNGIEAVSRVTEERFDLILMDIQMPEMDGITATTRIRELENCGIDELPIIAMTAHAMAGDAERCIAAGMNGYIPKPIDPIELRSALKQWLPERLMIMNAQAVHDDLQPAASWVQVLESHGIEASDALKVIHGNEAFFRKMLMKFTEEYHESPAKIFALLNEGDFEGAHLMAHSIKSVSGYIGAQTLWQHTVELETAIKEKRPNWKPAFTRFSDSIVSVTDIIHMAFSIGETE